MSWVDRAVCLAAIAAGTAAYITAVIALRRNWRHDDPS